MTKVSAALIVLGLVLSLVLSQVQKIEVFDHIIIGVGFAGLGASAVLT
jgi:hypothetical protein